MGQILLANYNDIATIENKIGAISGLNTPDTTDVVSAINSINLVSLRETIPEGTDLNDWIIPGKYQGTGSNYSTYINVPPSDWTGSNIAFSLIVMEMTASLIQIFIPRTDAGGYNNIYHRVHRNSGWNEWTYLPDCSDGYLRLESNTAKYPRIYMEANGLDMNQSNNGTTSNVWPGLCIMDKNGNPFGAFYSQVNPDGDMGAGIWNYNYNTSGQQAGTHNFMLFTDKSGKYRYSIGQPRALRKGAQLDIQKKTFSGTYSGTSGSWTNKDSMATFSSPGMLWGYITISTPGSSKGYRAAQLRINGTNQTANYPSRVPTTDACQLYLPVCEILSSSTSQIGARSWHNIGSAQTISYYGRLIFIPNLTV